MLKKADKIFLKEKIYFTVKKKLKSIVKFFYEVCI